MGDAVQGGWAEEGFDDGAHEVVFPFGDAAAKEDEVEVELDLHGGGGCFGVVGKVLVVSELCTELVEGGAEGDAVGLADLVRGGFMGSKQCSNLIPLCHPLLLSKIDVKCESMDDGVEVTSTVICSGQTGVEMEALTAVSTTLLTIYDMCKAVDKNMTMRGIRLIEKTKE